MFCSPGNEHQFKLRSPRLILPPSPVASEKEEFESTTGTVNVLLVETLLLSY